VGLFPGAVHGQRGGSFGGRSGGGLAATA
jgi:hypothetical protein